MKFKLLLFVTAVSALVACGGDGVKVQRKPLSVKVQEVKPVNVSIVKRYPADIIGKVYVDIKPQVMGYIDKVVAEEGAKVRKGEVIVKISEDSYVQAVSSARANVEIAKANIENAKLDVERTQSLYDNEIVSEFDLKSAKNVLLLNEAQLNQAIAQLQKAEVNLQFTDVVSPTDGVIGTISVSSGTLVSPSDINPITTVSDTKTMFTYFALSEVDLLNMTPKSADIAINKVFKNPKLLLANGKEYDKEGVLDVVSGVVDRATGTVTMRATFENNGILRGGSNGYILLPIVMDSVVLVPQSMTRALQDKIAVYVVQPDSTVITKFIEIMNETYEDKFIVTGGLNIGDLLIVENAIKISQGMKVTIDNNKK